jgi:hypothetical protein
MGMKVRSTGRLANVRLRPTARVMREALQEAANSTRRRTASGLDEDGKPFAAGADGQPVDLSASGRMLDDYNVTSATETRGTLGFSTDRSARLAALHEQGTRYMPARRFLGLDRRQRDAVFRWLKRAIRW